MTLEAPTIATPATERLRELPRRLAHETDLSIVMEALAEGRPATIDGAWGSACALAAAALAEASPGPLVFVTPWIDALDELADDFSLFSPLAAARFPAWESAQSERLIHDEVFGERLRALKSLRGESPPRCLMTSIQALLQPTPTAASLAGHSRRMAIGDRVDIAEFLRWLAEHRFQGTSAIELPGEFSHRGGILDVFAADWDAPVRIELFDDLVESLRLFDVATQRSLERLGEIEITALTPGQAISGRFSEFLPAKSWIMLLEPEQIEEEARGYLKRLEKPQELHGLSETLADLARFPLLTAAGLARSTAEASCRLPVESVERFSGELAEVKRELDRVGEDCETIIVASTPGEIERLSEMLADTQLAQRGGLHFAEGYLHEGFRLTAERLLLISGAELFRRQELRRAPRRRHLGQALDSFLDLREGQLVVHLAHGIGRYRGLKLLERAGQKEEHLELEFRGGTRIYVPATRIDLVQKYIGGTRRRPPLAVIGGQTWLKQKKAAEAAVQDLAVEMLEVQAQRMKRPGIAFPRDSLWQHEFDASFPYEETGDQLESIAAIKGDMQRPKPMDRLLCGDVGFGKTEVAMRAVFKAIESGYQVAVLVPTTILAEQHYRTFRDRMAEFPFDIRRLSRFCTSGEQREIIDGLKTGRVDVVIGTHRLASQDVKFFNLGLVIIDEEQRFGVEVKERLKSLRTTVDVLTMSATPIPRTLHMSLVGVRDISNLQIAPEERVAVETRLTRFDEELIRRALLRELNRGGQAYFVHNRVRDIEALASRLRRIVPEASLRIGHGQMPESELEEVMVDFVAGRFDVLLATTIVESGLDIPNANTIFIDEANRYGLADLHQLRGRVGRYKHRAYCYLLIDPHKHLNPNAARRLRAIEEFSELGAGFSLAMRDLEIRGAGNLLGTQQSGHIAVIGYELYCQLLENAVRRLKDMPEKRRAEVEIDLPGEAFLPDDYVGEMRIKIDLYRRLARVAGFDDVAELRGELIDRFGEPPPAVRRLLSLAELKLEAAVWQIRSIKLEDRFLAFGYADRGRIEHLARLSGGRLRVVDDESAYVTLKTGVTDPDSLLAAARSVVQFGK